MNLKKNYYNINFSPWFIFRRRVDRLLATIMPGAVIPLYEMVVFSPSIPYRYESMNLDKTLLIMVVWWYGGS